MGSKGETERKKEMIDRKKDEGREGKREGRKEGGGGRRRQEEAGGGGRAGRGGGGREGQIREKILGCGVSSPHPYKEMPQREYAFPRGAL